MTWDACASRYSNAEEMLAGYATVRQRIERPAVSHVDRGIDLRRGRPEPQRRRAPAPDLSNEPEPVLTTPRESGQISSFAWSVCSSDVTARFATWDQPRSAKPLWKDIVKQTARKHGCSFHDIIGPWRLRRVILARHEAMYRLRYDPMLNLSFPRIGQLLGGRDHTTVMHGVRQHQARLDRGEA